MRRVGRTSRPSQLQVHPCPGGGPQEAPTCRRCLPPGCWGHRRPADRGWGSRCCWSRCSTRATQVPGRAEGLGPSLWGDHHGLRPSTCHVFWANSSQEAFSREVRAPGCPVTRDRMPAPLLTMRRGRFVAIYKPQVEYSAPGCTSHIPGAWHLPASGQKALSTTRSSEAHGARRRGKGGALVRFFPKQTRNETSEGETSEKPGPVGRLCGRSPANCWEDSRQAGSSPPPHPQQGPL